MNAVVVKNELQISQWASLVQECQSSGMKKSDWLRSKGITKDQYRMLMQGLEVIARRPITIMDDPPTAM